MADQTDEVLRTIPGGPELLSWLGGSAGFHDAEIRSLVLRRDGVSKLEVFVIWPAPGAVVTFLLADWIDTNIRGFSHQNVIFDLVVSQPDERHVDPWELGVGLVPGQHWIELVPTFGAFGTLRCTIQRIEFKLVSHDRQT